MKRLTPAEVGERYSVTPQTVIAWIQSGKLKAIDASRNPKQGKPRYRIAESDLQAFEQACTVGETPRVRTRRRKPKRDVIQFY